MYDEIITPLINYTFYENVLLLMLFKVGYNILVYFCLLVQCESGLACTQIYIIWIIYTGCPIKNGTVDFQYIASRKLSIFLRHRISIFRRRE